MAIRALRMYSSRHRVLAQIALDLGAFIELADIAAGAGAVQFIVLPLTFLSSTFLQPNLMPSWIRSVSDFNPVNWAVVAGRAATGANPDWGLVASQVGFLVALLGLCSWFATRAFRAYQELGYREAGGACTPGPDRACAVRRGPACGPRNTH